MRPLTYQVFLLLAMVIPFFLCARMHAQTNEWAWIDGTETPVTPVYGTLGTPAPGNFPGARESSASWTDDKGNLWIFGGTGVDSSGRYGYLNELWEFSPSTNEWAWMGGSNAADGMEAPGVYGTLGVPAPGNVPPGREGAITWLDAKGNFWLFGGDAFGAGEFSDLWQFNPSTDEWAWMGGSNTPNNPGVYGTLGTPAMQNVPGSRTGSVSWTDLQGNFWLFGGMTVNPNGACGVYLNDLWRFNPSTNEWAWMSGSGSIPECSASSFGEPGVYGTEGVAAAATVPGSRSLASAWTDKKGNLWLFGGDGFDSAAVQGILNDLWEFNPSTGQWAWKGGNSTFPAACVGSVSSGCYFAGVYGTLQMAGAASAPGSREGAVNWTDSKGNLWLFGGWGIDSNGNVGFLGDLWQLSASSGQWIWMNGSSTLDCAYLYCGELGTYGTQHTPALGNTPSGREFATSWTDSSGNFWLLGGEGINVTGTLADLQDLWEFEPNTSGQLVTATPTFSPNAGTYTSLQTLTIEDTTPGATIFYVINGNLPASEYTGPIPLTSSETVEAISGAAGYANSDIATASYTLHVSPAAAPVFSVASGSYSSPQTVSITDTTHGAAIYYTTDGTAPTTSSALYSGPITVSSSETVLAVAVANGDLLSKIASAVYTIGPDSTLGQWTWVGGSSQANQSGVYGTLRTPASGSIPGARYGATSWTDSKGNFWVFGGGGLDSAGNSGYLNDLWEFNPSTKLWTWMGGSKTVNCSYSICSAPAGVYGTEGVFAAGNMPGGRALATNWMDATGHVWLFGGYGIDEAGLEEGLNDLWEFDPTKNQWAWMGGSKVAQISDYCLSGAFACTGAPGIYGVLGVPASGNVPGSRYQAASWVDNNGNFWLFGGTGEDSTGYSENLNDLWEFYPSRMEWVWMGGSSTVNVVLGYQEGSYGTLGVPSEENFPGSRFGAAAWTDSKGALWLFGGVGGGLVDSQGNFNDLWKYDISSHEWSWMAGGSGAYCALYPFFGLKTCKSQPAVYGTLGLPATENTPGGSSSAASWRGKSGDLWLFGATNSDVTGEENGFYLGGANNLWFLDPSTSQWSWMEGDYATSNCHWIVTIFIVYPNCDGPQGVYGSLGVPAAGNIPGARTGAVTWTDDSGNLWLFSGMMENTSDAFVYTNDLWMYQPSPNTFPAAASPIFSLSPGNYLPGSALLLANGMANASIYYTTDGSTPSTKSTLYSGPITLNSNANIQAMAVAPGYRNSVVTSADYTIATLPVAPVYSPAPGTYSSAQSVAITDAAPSSVIYYTTDGTAPNSSSPTYSGPITVSSTETLNAVGVVNGYANSVYYGIDFPGLGGIGSTVASATYNITLPATATPTFSLPSRSYVGAQSVTISDTTPSATIYYTTDGSTPTTNSNVYSSPITVAYTDTLHALATASGYAPSAITSATYTITPTPPSFSISGTSVSVASGATTGNTSTVSVTPIGGFTGAVALSCTIAPVAASGPATCNIPASITVSGISAQTTTLIVNTTAAATALNRQDRSFRPIVGGTALACMLLFGIPLRRRSWQRLLGILVLLLCFGTGAISCGGGGSGGGGGGGNPGTTPGAYLITVTGVSGSITQSGTISLTVQ